MSIPVLNNEEKSQTIEAIVSQGLENNRKTNIKDTAGFFRVAGIRGLFFGMGDAAAIGLMLSALAAILMVGVSNELAYPMLFWLSPFCFGVMTWLTLWKEWEWGVREVAASCKISIRQMTALRMMVFGGIGLIFVMGVTAGFWIFCRGLYMFWSMAGVSMCALFIYGGLTVAAMGLKKQVNLWLPAVWTLTALVMTIYNEKSIEIITSLPLWTLWAAAAAGLLFFIYELDSYAGKGVYSYA